MRRTLTILLLVALVLPTVAQHAARYKLSPMLRQMVRQQSNASRAASKSPRNTETPEVCAFVRVASTSSDVLSDYGCRSLAAVGDIHVASIPVDCLGALSLDRRVLRIEARPMGHVLLDSVSRSVNAVPVYEAMQLPQAYTGRGVVVGLMDIGFDFTHPTFRFADGSSRIRHFWDMLSTDTIGSSFYVGRDYTTPEEILSLAHSRDGLDQTHGTHTAGIAVGNGYDSPYRGLAPESDICLVANATGNNVELIDSALLSRFNFTTDALGFKYLFDYANQTNQPCVVSFSEGEMQDFWGYDQLWYEMINALLGPGRIMVVAAGNEGRVKSWFSKPAGPETKGMFIRKSGNIMMLTLKSTADFRLRIVSYADDAAAETFTVAASDVLSSPDSLLVLKSQLSPLPFDSVAVEAYPNCYDSHETCYDISFYSAEGQIGTSTPLSVEVLDNLDEVTCWRVNGDWTTNSLNPLLDAGETTHNILSPASAPRVICVGATTWRDGIWNHQGDWKEYWKAPVGERAPFSSVGPTMDGLTKPDVMAPGNNIISAYSSYYLENHPTANDIKWDVSHFDYEGRTYAWNANTGTSMSCPVVAGVIALWLQAKPDLTPEDVMGVISRTSRRPETGLEYPNNLYGYGEIDAYRGLLDILGVDEIEAVSKTHTPASISLRGRQLTISLPSDAMLDGSTTLSLYTLDGRQVFRTTNLSLLSIPLPSSLASGVYAVQLDGPSAVQGSTLIRISQ